MSAAARASVSAHDSGTAEVLRPRVLHLWGNYFPDLFDFSHQLCLSAGWDSALVARSVFDDPASLPQNVSAFRRRTREELNSAKLRHRVQRRLLRDIDQIGFSWKTRSVVRKFDPTVFHCHFGTTAAELLRWRSLPRTPGVVSFYGVDASASLRDQTTVLYYREAASRGAVAHVLCAAVADRLAALGWPRGQIVEANLPAQVEDIPYVQPRTSGHGCLKLLMPARFVEKKGHTVLLDALKDIKSLPSSVEVTFFGYGPSAWLQKEITDRCLGDRVTIIDNGQAPDFRASYLRLLAEHDVILAPSIVSSTGDDEGGPALSLVMAQAAGKPVIVSDFPGAERSVHDCVEGYVVPAGDPQSLREAIARMARASAQWPAFGNAGRQRVLTEFSTSAYWRSLQSMYELALRFGSSNPSKNPA